MSSPAEARADRLRALEASILEGTSDESPDSPAEVSEISARAHRAIVRGTYGNEPTELRVRLHGDGVVGHQVPADQAGALLRQTQLVVRWIGARLRTLADEKQMPAKKGERLAVKDATRLFLQPQFGAGSLIFDLVGADHAAGEGDDDQGQVVDGASHVDALIDRALLELLSIVDSSEADSPEALGELSNYVARMGPRVASQLKQLSTHVTEDEINIELRWRSPRGSQKRSNLTRRGALAIKDAVDRNKVRTDEIFITGMLETVSTGKDQVRIETPEEPFKMDVDAELGVTLGNLLHREVTARVERKTIWHNSGRETMDYWLLAVTEEPRLDAHDDGSEEYVRPTPELPE